MERRAFLRLILGCWAALLSIRLGMAQESVDDVRRDLLLKQTRFLQFTLDLNGTLESASEPTQESFPAIEFFVHPVIVEELQISDSTSEKIRQLFDECTARAAALAQQPRETDDRSTRNKAGQGDASQADTAAFAVWNEFCDKVDECLTDYQAKRLKQLQWQFLLYRNGITTVLCNPRVSAAFGISTKNLLKSRGELEQLARDLLAKERELTEEALEKWLGELDENQRSVFAKFWSDKLQKSGSVGRLAWSLAYNRWSPIEENSGENKEFLQLNIPVLLHGADGNLWNNQKDDAKRLRELPEIRRLYVFQHFLSSEFVRELGGFSDGQISEVERIGVEVGEMTKEIAFDVAAEFEVPILDIRWVTLPDGTERRQVIYDWPVDRTQIDRMLEVRLRPLAKDARERLQNVILPHQLDAFIRISRQVEAHVRGPLADMEKGFLGERMGLTDADRNALSESAKRTLGFLGTESRKLRDETFDKALKDLSADDLETIKSVVGLPIQIGHCDLRNFAVALIIASRARDDVGDESETGDK